MQLVLSDEIAKALEEGLYYAGAMEWDSGLAAEIIRKMLHNYNVKPIVKETCKKCDGSGQFVWPEGEGPPASYSTRCSKCYGQGWVTSKETR